MMMEKGNKELVDSVQKISNQNSIDTRLMLNHLLRRVQRELGSIEIVKDGATFTELDKSLKEIVAKEIESFYTKNDTNQKVIDEKNKIIRLIQKRYGEHVLSLKESIKDKKEEVINLKIELQALNKWLDDINKKYETEKVKSEKFEIKVAELKEINKLFEESLANSDSSRVQLVDLKKYELEVEKLNKLVLELKAKNELVENLKQSIRLSSQTANTLKKLAEEEKNKIDEMEKKIYKISLNIKNKRRYKEVIKYAKKFEDDLEEIKALVADIKYDPKITLRLLQSDLEKIESIMNEVRWSRFDAIYCTVRFVVLGAIVVVGSLFFDKSYLDWIDNLPF